MPTAALDLELAAACAVAREAGALALRRFRGRDRLAIEHKGLQDLVSEADREVEAVIRGRLATLFPADGFLGEEGGHAPAGAATWVVDPIDGTWCFLNGIASWCVSLARVRDRRIELGVIHDPCAGELFAARAGGGATLDGAPIRVAEARTLADGTVSVGFSHRSRPEEVAPIFGRLLEAGGMYHRHGSGALGLAWTACGRLIGYVEPHMNSWDALAGLLLVEEAGGRVREFLAGDGLFRGNRVLAAAPAIYPLLEELTGWR
ncbi:MAG: inositol monophosphatase [Geminicoccaceae bacterium]|nr:inositol monophosphatase [Geminicoccaceae bacterium]